VAAPEIADAARPFITMVIPVRNEADTIDDCLARCLAQSYPAGRFEILVVDGVSDDGTPDRVRAWGTRDPRVRLLDNPEQITPVAMNIGIREARGDLIAWMSGHASPEPDYLDRAAASIGATGAWCFGGSMKRTGATEMQRAIAIASSSRFGLGNAVHHYGHEPQWVETAYPGFWPRTVFERVGLFDPELVRNQDDELSFRIRRAGGRIWFDPRIEVEYQARGSLRGVFSQYRQYGMWKVRVFQKHPRAARWRQLIPPAFVAAVGGGIVVGVVWPPALIGAGLTLAAYLGFIGIGGAKLAARGARPVSIVASLAAVHLGYGVGFWQGLIRFAPRWFVNRHGRIEYLEPRPE
jgi:glycosyltransferase involved in cell wall biosynthesis